MNNTTYIREFINELPQIVGQHLAKSFELQKEYLSLIQKHLQQDEVALKAFVFPHNPLNYGSKISVRVRKKTADELEAERINFFVENLTTYQHERLPPTQRRC